MRTQRVAIGYMLIAAHSCPGTIFVPGFTTHSKAVIMEPSNEKFEFPTSTHTGSQGPVSSGVQPPVTESPVPLMVSGAAEQGRDYFGQELPRAVDFSTTHFDRRNTSSKRWATPVAAVALVAVAGLVIAAFAPSLTRRVARSYGR